MVGLVPTPTDRADYYPNPQGARTLSWALAQSATGTTDELLLQDVSDWQSLIFQTDATGVPVSAGVYTVSWFTNPQGTLACGTDTLCVGVAMDAYVVIPVRAPYVKVQSASITGAGTHVAGGRWLVSSLPPSELTLPHVPLDAAASVPINGNTQVTGTSVRSGPAHLIGSNLQSTTGWWVDVQALNPFSNVFGAVARVGAASAYAFSDRFTLPPWPIKAFLRNTDTAAVHTVVCTVTVGY